METQDPQFGDVILRLYQEADTLLGELLNELDDHTTLIIVSDHGAGSLKKTVSINRWLFEEGYLALKQKGIAGRLWHRLFVDLSVLTKRTLPSSIKTRLKAQFALQDKAESHLLSSQIEWTETRAFCLGEYGGIFINLQGREAAGTVPIGEYEQLRDEIAERLLNLHDPTTGQPIIRRVYRREEIYDGPYVAQAPDLVLDWDYRYECRSRIENIASSNKVFSEKGEYIPFTHTVKTGTHRPLGILIMYGVPIQPGPIQGAHLLDIAPTLLHLCGVPVPDDMDGRVLTEALRPEWLAQHPVTYQKDESEIAEAQSSSYSEVEERKVKERLRSLGYLD
jgi:predicted AlkP superfamily phosphohydrolase/phosphomutase